MLDRCSPGVRQIYNSNGLLRSLRRPGNPTSALDSGRPFCIPREGRRPLSRSKLSYLQPNELQDLADGLTAIMELQAKYGIKIRFNLAVEVTTEADLKPEATTEVRKELDDISDAWH